MATFRCEVCSELLQEGTTRCPRCGKGVSAAGAAPTPPPAPPMPPPTAPSGGWDAPPPGFEARPPAPAGFGEPYAPPSGPSSAPPPPPPGQPPTAPQWGAGTPGWNPPTAPPVPSKGGRTGVVVAVSVVGGVLVLGILAILAVTLLGRSTDDQAIPDSYTPELEAEFIRGCTSTGGTGAQCQCALEEVERLYTIDEFVDLSLEMQRGGTLPPELQSAILQKCL